jgi:type IV secretory pathway VirB6-like protein
MVKIRWYSYLVIILLGLLVIPIAIALFPVFILMIIFDRTDYEIKDFD